MNDERQLVNRLDRFGRRLKEMAERIREETESDARLARPQTFLISKIKKAGETLDGVCVFERAAPYGTCVCRNQP